MRALKTILIILAVLLVTGLILGLTGPDTYRYERTVTVAAPADVVYGNVSSLTAMDTWSPWNALDPDMRKSIEGTDGTVGAVSKWEGNDDVGKGEQRIDSLAPNSFVRTHLTFIEPWASESDALVELAPAGDSTTVTWAMVGENNFMSKLLCKFMDMDAMIGKDFEQGLSNLKAISEEQHAAALAERKEKTFNGHVIETIEWPETVYIGKRNKRVKWTDLSNYYAATLGAAHEALTQAQLEPAGAPSGVYFAWNVADRSADLMPGIPVKADAGVKVPGMDTHVVPACTMLHITYHGDYEGIGGAHEAMDACIGARGLTHYGNVIEEYVTNPGEEPDTTKWLTNLYYMVR